MKQLGQASPPPTPQTNPASVFKKSQVPDTDTNRDREQESRPSLIVGRMKDYYMQMRCKIVTINKNNVGWKVHYYRIELI